ncbi:MAG: hypothetical protein FWC69_03710 [Defluviitaleaceae bacterium]|nr:hypothetical protein [Defluviitaleaceae bacterium]
MKRIVYPMVFVMMALLLAFGGIVLFSFISSDDSLSNVYGDLALPFDEEPLAPQQNATADEVMNGALEGEEDVYRISNETVMIYDYFNPQTESFERVQEASPSPFLLGRSRDELENIFADWQIIYFSPYEVHLQQNKTLQSRQFIISVHEGFVAVFYDDDDKSIKELTTRPISSLPQPEQQRLIDGIKIIGNEDLLRALEDFGS